MQSAPEDPLDTPSNLQLGRGLVLALVGMTVVLMYFIGFPFDEMEFHRRGRSIALSQIQSALFVVLFGGIGVFGLAQAATAKLHSKGLVKYLNLIGKAGLYSGAVLFVGSLIFGA